MIPRGEIYLDTVYITDTDDGAKLLRQGFGTTCVSLRKGQPSAITLMDEEAMYMILRDLLVVSCTSSIDALWSMFCRKNAMFPYKYKTYTHFKENGYTVKSGTNFGMDYSVYRLTPNCSHSEFCIRVTTEASEGNDWRSISTTTRVMPDVMKLFILSIVTFQKSSSSSYLDLFTSTTAINEPDVASVKCLEKMEIRLLSTVIRRLPVTKENYLTISGWQLKYRKSTKLSTARVEGAFKPPIPQIAIASGLKGKTEKKHQRKRRNHLEIRSKGKSTKSSVIWENLTTSVV